MFNLIWEGEVIDTVDTREEAAYLANEYKMAYGGGAITIAEAEGDDNDPFWEPSSYDEYQDLFGGDDMFADAVFADDY